MAAYLWANRLLPVAMDSRAAWEMHLFFLAWAAMFVHAALRTAKRAWIEQFLLAALLLALLPVLTAMTTSHPLWHALAMGDWAFAGTDLTLLALAALHSLLAWRTWRHAPKAKRARPSAASRNAVPEAGA